ncbi:hypothetical protein EDC22_105107 [Tepidamorphus gemmatus]|uniref:UrcA family protein n=1 Tax=Tepidamorphus gemmatus TaxID=747076 RepID=A0A4V2UZB1_9HYPH|nr:hypothetical protein [Tepidamorphus gemmatus]TCT10608.1 hypothetical protein EDC22_105107 [Tepidamorphus gemmatus]
MFATRTMIVLSAIAATGIVALAQPSQSGQAVGVDYVKLQDRHPAFSSSSDLRGALEAERSGAARVAPVSTPKGDRLDMVERSCADVTWPNVPRHCLTVSDDVAADRPVRTVAIAEDGSSSIVSRSSTVLAQR